jgi:hypothetical protein
MPVELQELTDRFQFRDTPGSEVAWPPPAAASEQSPLKPDPSKAVAWPPEPKQVKPILWPADRPVSRECLPLLPPSTVQPILPVPVLPWTELANQPLIPLSYAVPPPVQPVIRETKPAIILIPRSPPQQQPQPPRPCLFNPRHEHMVYVVVPHANREYACSVCQTSSQQGYLCTPCDFFLCMPCAGIKPRTPDPAEPADDASAPAHESSDGDGDQSVDTASLPRMTRAFSDRRKKHDFKVLPKITPGNDSSGSGSEDGNVPRRHKRTVAHIEADNIEADIGNTDGKRRRTQPTESESQ